MTEPVQLTKQQQFLFDWLSQADVSALGECEGPALDALIAAGLAEVINRDRGGWAGVKLTEAGWKIIVERSAGR